MSMAATQPMTLDAFLEWERRQDARHEFDGVAAVAMNGGSIEHSMIATNLVTLLGASLRGGPCHAVRGDMKIIVKDRVRYPDVVVTCTPIPRGADIVPAPVVVFEVLSPSTSSVDHIAKNEEYRSTPSILRYVIVEQSQKAAVVFRRDGENWLSQIVSGDDVLALPEIGVELRLPDLYAGLDELA